jgi:hypothetical protein
LLVISGEFECENHEGEGSKK